MRFFGARPTRDKVEDASPKRFGSGVTCAKVLGSVSN